MLALAACSKRPATLHGATYEAAVPNGWHRGTHPFADDIRALANGTPAHADVQTLVDDHDHAIILAEFIVGEPPERLPAPQANLMSTMAPTVHVPPLTDASCGRLFERFHLPATAHKLELGHSDGCVGTSPDGARRIAILDVDPQTVIAMCSAEADRACDSVLRSIRPRRTK